MWCLFLYPHWVGHQCIHAWHLFVAPKTRTAIGMPIRSDRFPAPNVTCLVCLSMFGSFCTVALYWRAASLHPFSLKGATFINFLSKMQPQFTSECLGLSHAMPVILLTEFVSPKNIHPCFTTMFPSNVSTGISNLCKSARFFGGSGITSVFDGWTWVKKKTTGDVWHQVGFMGLTECFVFVYVGIFNEHHRNNGGNTAKSTLTKPRQVNFWRCGPSFSFWQLFNSAKGIEYPHHLLKGCRNKAVFKRRKKVACWWIILRTDRQHQHLTTTYLGVPVPSEGYQSRSYLHSLCKSNSAVTQRPEKIWTFSKEPSKLP